MPGYLIKKRICTVIYFLLFIALNINAQPERDAAYISLTNNNISAWETIIDNMAAEAVMSEQRLLLLLELEYGYIGWCVNTKRKNEAKRYMKRYEDHIQIAQDQGYDKSMVSAHKSALYGFKIFFNNMKGIFLGNKSVSEARKSISLNPDNSFGYIQLGNIKYYTPPLLGGDRDEALSYYLKALTIMDKDNNNSWIYLHLLIMIAVIYDKAGDKENADLYFRKVYLRAPALKGVIGDMFQVT